MKAIKYTGGVLKFRSEEYGNEQLIPVDIRRRMYSTGQQVVQFTTKEVYAGFLYKYHLTFFSIDGAIWQGFCRYKEPVQKLNSPLVAENVQNPLTAVSITVKEGKLSVQADWIDDGVTWEMSLDATEAEEHDCQDDEQPYESIFRS